MASHFTSTGAAASSSSGADWPFADALRTSLALLRRECPTAWRRMCARLGRRALTIRVDGVAVDVAGHHVHVEVGAPAQPIVEVETSRAAIVALADGRDDLLDALLAERVVIRGGVADVHALYEGLVDYVRGAIRSPSFPQLLARFRGDAAPAANREEPCGP